MAPPTPETRVADAINRVLEAEREMAGAIVEAQAAAQATIESARESRRTLLETARRRTLRVHDAMQAQVAARLAQLDAAGTDTDPESADLDSAIEAATARLAVRLTSDSVS
jgi:predicted RNase H-like nuclease